MSGGLIPAALRAISRRGKTKPTPDLRRYLIDNGIGRWEGEQVLLGPKARADLGAALLRDFQVPIGTTAEAWEGLSRTEALTFTTNEKSSSRAVRSKRVAVKALGGAKLHMGQAELELPSGLSLDVSDDDAHLFEGHHAVILVENWEAFERIDKLSFEIPSELLGALVVYRGEMGAYPIAAARAFLLNLGRPIHVFPDPDPAGLKLAMDFPGFSGLVLPPCDELAAIFRAGRGDTARYLAQLPGTERVLNEATNPQIQDYWRVIKAAGRALPQEEFVRG